MPMSVDAMQSMLNEMLIGLRAFTNREGVMMVESAIPRGRPEETSITLCTHDFTDKTTWYQMSIKVDDEQPTSSDNKNFQLAHFPIINYNSPKLYARDMALLLKDGAFVDRILYRVVVKINDESVLQENTNYGWNINYNTGLITFNNIPNGSVVTVSYYYVPSQGGSRFILRPQYGSRIVIEHVECQFSIETTINDNIVFEVWGGSPDVSVYLNPAYRNSPINPWRQAYRSAHDFVNNCNLGQGSIPAFGGNTGRGLTKPTIVFPFDYIQAFLIESNLNSELHVYLENDTPYTDCEIATASFYSLIETYE